MCKQFIEVYRRHIKELGSFEKAVQEGYYTKWDKEKIKEAFNSGNGTINHFKNYVANNKGICIFKEIQ